MSLLLQNHKDVHMLSFARFHKDQKPMALQQTQEIIQITKL
jgi:hypothetical protein